MRILSGALIVGISLTAIRADAEEWRPEWKASYAAAYQAGRETRRPVLVVIDKPAEPAYRVESVSGRFDAPTERDAALLAGYEMCHIDASTDYGQKVAESFGVKQFPYVAITDRRVEVLLFEKAGHMSQAEWAATLAKHRSGEVEQPAVICTT
jgi:hypothetical protein